MHLQKITKVADDRKVLKFAVMCNAHSLQQWQADAIEELLTHANARLVLLVLPDKQAQTQPGLFFRIRHYRWDKLFFKQYYRHLFRPDSFRPADVSGLFQDVPEVRCRITLKHKYSEYFSKEDIEKIGAYQPDFILKFGFGIVRGDILNSVPYGIWSFHHGDEQKYRGVPPAFWEILRQDSVTGAILQRLTETLDSGIILRKGFFPTINHSWKANLDQVIELSKNWPADVCREIIQQRTFVSESDRPMPGVPVLKEPGNYTFVQFLARQASNKILFHFRELFLAEKWQTGLIKARPAEIEAGIGYIIDSEGVSWLSAPGPDRYFADGFVTREDGRLLLFFESYDYSRHKAVIASSWFNEREASFTPPLTILEETWHLSYPFTFRSDGTLYCIPESLGHGSIELYRFDFTSHTLVHERTLVEGIAAADPTLVFHQNHWYLFFSSARATNVELHIWHADTLEGPFSPHELNPVKADISNARPAGSFFTLDGNLYRPAQDCSLTYGGRIVINEVKILSEDAYLEMPVSVLEPPEGYTGLHNLSFAGDFMYFDCKKVRFSPANFHWQILRRMGIYQRNPRPAQ